jgi:hypothetical protein
MLTSIIKATRAHYAALQHKPSPDRVALGYEVTGHTAGTVWVKAPTKPLQRAAVTRLLHRLRSMYPEVHVERISCGFRESEKLAPLVQLFAVQVQADSSGTWAGNGLTFDTYADAEAYARDLMSRWTLVTAWRVVLAENAHVKT